MNEYGGVSKTVYAEKTASNVPEVKMVLEQLDKEIYRLEEEVKGLANQLAHVSLPEISIPKDLSVKDVPQPPHSDMFIHINMMRVRLVELNIFFSDLKQRLEI